MLVWSDLAVHMQHGPHLQASSRQCAVGAGMFHISVGSFKPCSGDEMRWDNPNLDLQKPGSQMLPYRRVPLCRGRRREAVACCADLACFLLPPLATSFLS